MNREEVKKFKGKICWLNVTDDMINSIMVPNEIERDDNTFRGRFKIIDVQWYDIKSLDGKEYSQGIFYIHPLTCPAAKYKLNFPIFLQALEKFEDDVDTIVFKILGSMFKRNR